MGVKLCGCEQQHDSKPKANGNKMLLGVLSLSVKEA